LSCVRALAAVLLVGGCVHTRPCADGTLFVDVTLDAVTAAADYLQIGVTVDSGATMWQPLAHQPGGDHGSVEVVFPHGWPGPGHRVTVDVIASLRGAFLGEERATLALDDGCGALAVDVAAAPDGGVALDGAVAPPELSAPTGLADE
jgi:hypothetical protein